MPISVVILTFNSEASIGKTLASVAGLSDDIHVVDSYSKDRTLDISREFGANVTEHSFENYGAQRNWAIENLPLKHDWQLHLDADERLSDALLAEIKALNVGEGGVVGYHVPRLMHFMDKPIRHGAMFPTWHMRLFKTGMGHCEARLYDQHFYADGPTQQLKNHMVDDIQMSLSEWTARHNRWADAEVQEILAKQTDRRVQASFWGNPVERKRYLRGLYDRTPLFVRPFALFFYRYFLRFGFLDGSEGFIFYVLQTFWFRFIVDAKLYEARRAARRKAIPTQVEPEPVASRG
ncbi:glycosyltransferase family 2 protein [Singulisphaera sp. PoT]|uniref:glycosyltransferase family 2 protein n=1 Tax=Singulisphaera sp. PoT TaxID=3411797 RepID=UPI003BF5827D